MTRRLPSRFDDAHASPGFLLWRTTNRWQAAIRAALAPFSLTHVQFVLLATLAWADAEDGLSQTETAARARVDAMMVSQVIRVLERKGLVRREPDPRDRRAIRVTVTPAGIELAGAANHAVETADADFFGADARRRATLVEHLRRLDDDA